METGQQEEGIFSRSSGRLPTTLTLSFRRHLLWVRPRSPREVTTPRTGPLPGPLGSDGATEGEEDQKGTKGTRVFLDHSQ